MVYFSIASWLLSQNPTVRTGPLEIVVICLLFVLFVLVRGGCGS